VLALNQLSMHADCVMPIENQALADICKKVCDSQFPCMLIIFNDIQNSQFALKTLIQSSLLRVTEGREKSAGQRQQYAEC
jgi:hypothetical protein